jgi:hypothetical protein
MKTAKDPTTSIGLVRVSHAGMAWVANIKKNTEGEIGFLFINRNIPAKSVKRKFRVRMSFGETTFIPRFHIIQRTNPHHENS